MKILIFIDHSIMARHFLNNNAFGLLSEQNDVSFVLPFGHKRVSDVKINPLEVENSKYIDLPVCQKRVSLWRMRSDVERLRGYKGWSKPQLKDNRKLFCKVNPLKLYFLYRFLGLFGIFNIFTLYIRSKLSKSPNKDLENLLKTYEPNIIIHPSVLEGVYIDDLVEAGEKLNIPTLVVMNSWDNPSSKRTVVSNNFWLLVWGPQTRGHAERLMDMPPEKVVEFGAAQFDIYLSPPRLSKSELLDNQKINNNKLNLLYAGSSKSTDEFSHLLKIDQAIEDGLLPDINVIYRPHPWGGGGKNGSRFLRHDFKNVVIDENMRSYLENINKNSASHICMPDYADTRDLLSIVDAVISPLSTMIIEAMIIGIPPMCYMPVDEEDDNHFKWAMNQVHFKELLSMDEVIVSWGSESLLTGLTKLIERASTKTFKNRLQKSSEFYVRSFKEPFSQRIIKLIDNIYINN